MFKYVLPKLVGEILKKEKKMKFRIYWLEYHDPMNWGETEEEGIKNMYDLLPAKDIHLDPNENDGWVECECEDTFEANSIEEAKKIANEYDCGSSSVFSVFDEKGEVVFTEEDLGEV